MTTTLDKEVIIIGSGISGISTLDQILTAKPNSDIMVLDAGKIPGKGSEQYFSGTNCAQMVCTSYESDRETYEEAIGKSGANRFIQSAQEGAGILLNRAKSLDPSLILQQKGAIMVAKDAEDAQWLREELGNYQGANLSSKGMRIVPAAEVNLEFRTQPRNSRYAFRDGLYFPTDFTIDASRYTSTLAGEHMSKPNVNFEQVYVQKVTQDKGYATVHTDRGDITARQVVIAAGAAGAQMFSPLESVLEGHTSYIAVFPFDGTSTPNGWNTKDTYEYWTASGDGTIRIGGQDNKVKGTKYASEFAQHNLENIKRFARNHFGITASPIDQIWGVWTATPDEMPVIGQLSQSVYVIDGCNGMGLSTLSHGATLMPGIMGAAPLTAAQQPFVKLYDPSRASLRN